MATNPGTKKLSLELTDEQLKALRPILEATGELRIAGTITGRQLDVSFLACNAAFIACNAAFNVVSPSRAK